jgi:predicted amidohydrolase YtcJ
VGRGTARACLRGVTHGRGPEQRVPLDLALRATTIEAAFSLGLGDEIGSIAPGKRADFAVLERDPYEVPIEELHGIAIWGTLFEGRLYPID